MNKGKLETIIKYFDKYEQNRIRKFLESPFFNKSSAIVTLYNELLKLNISKKKKSREQIWQTIYPLKEFNYTRFRKLQSDLLKLIEQYLAYSAYEKNPLHQATYLMDAVSERKMEKLYATAQRSSDRLSNLEKHRHSTHYYYQYHIEKLKYELQQFDTQRTIKTNEEEIAKNLDYFYLSEKLKIYCSILGRQKFIESEWDILFIEEIINHVEQNDYNDIPAVSIYYKIYKTLTEPENEDHYFALTKILEEYTNIFPKEEAIMIYDAALNYCIREINKGNQKYLLEFFKLSKKMLIAGLLFNESNQITTQDFKNITTSGLRLKEFDWIDNFISNYSKYLPEEQRENSVTYNRAQYYMHKKQFDEAIFLLQQIEYEDILYNLNSKIMLIAAFYEMDYIESLYSLFDSFRVFLNRKKDLASSRKKTFLNFIKYTKKLSNIMKGEKKNLLKLKNDIESSETGIVNKAWILEKIEEKL